MPGEGTPKTYYITKQDGSRELASYTGHSETYIAKAPYSPIITQGSNSNGHNGNGHNGNGNSHNGNGHNENSYHPSTPESYNPGAERLGKLYNHVLEEPVSEQQELRFKAIINNLWVAQGDNHSNGNGHNNGNGNGPYNQKTDIGVFFETVGEYLMQEYSLDNRSDRSLESAIRMENLADIAVGKRDRRSAIYLHLKSGERYMEIADSGLMETFTSGGYEYSIKERVVAQTRKVLELGTQNGRDTGDAVLDSLNGILQKNEAAFDTDTLYPLAVVGLERFKKWQNGEELEPGFSDFVDVANGIYHARIEKCLVEGDRQGVLDACEANLKLLLDLYGMNSPKIEKLAGTMFSDSHEIAVLDQDSEGDIIDSALKTTESVNVYGRMMRKTGFYDRKFSELFFDHLSRKITAYEYYRKYKGDDDKLTFAQFALLDQIAAYMSVKRGITPKSIALIESAAGFPVTELSQTEGTAIAEKYYYDVAMATVGPDVEGQDKNKVIKEATETFKDEASQVFWSNRPEQLEHREYNLIPREGFDFGERGEAYNNLLSDMSLLDNDIQSQEDLMIIARDASVNIRSVAGTESIEMVRMQTVLMNRIREQIQKFENRFNVTQIRNDQRSKSLLGRAEQVAGIFTRKAPFQEELPSYDMLHEYLLGEAEMLGKSITEYERKAISNGGRSRGDIEAVRRSRRDLVEVAVSVYNQVADQPSLVDRILLLVAEHDMNEFGRLTGSLSFSQDKSEIHELLLKLHEVDPRTVGSSNLEIINEEIGRASEKNGKLSLGDHDLLKLCSQRLVDLRGRLVKRLNNGRVDLGGISTSDGWGRTDASRVLSPATVI